MEHVVSLDTANELTGDFSHCRANRVARNACTALNVLGAARSPKALRTYKDTYGVRLKNAKTVTNQRQSGRCWMFSTMNVLRADILETLDVDDFEFSQAYGMFYDKYEKANIFLNHIIETADKDIDDRFVRILLDNPIPDGGEWRFCANIIEKWGLVPKDVMPETACSKDSKEMNTVLARILRKDAYILREAYANGSSHEDLVGMQDDMMKQVHRILCVCLGEPPCSFDFELAVGQNAKVDSSLIKEQLPAPRENAFGENAKSRWILRDYGITPQDFAERYVGFNADDYIELISIPDASHSFNELFSVKFLDNIAGAPKCKFLNVEMNVLEQAVIKSLKAGKPCYMACDVAQNFPRHIDDFPYVLSLDGTDQQALFNVDFEMTKAQMYTTRESQLTHAMTFQGVELDNDGQPVAWRIENSWGKDAGKDGYLIASADWWKLYGGDAVVKREFVAPEYLEMWDTQQVHIDDPWSTLANAISYIG